MSEPTSCMEEAALDLSQAIARGEQQVLPTEWLSLANHLLQIGDYARVEVELPHVMQFGLLSDLTFDAARAHKLTELTMYLAMSGEASLPVPNDRGIWRSVYQSIEIGEATEALQALPWQLPLKSIAYAILVGAEGRADLGNCTGATADWIAAAQLAFDFDRFDLLRGLIAALIAKGTPAIDWVRMSQVLHDRHKIVQNSLKNRDFAESLLRIARQMSSEEKCRPIYSLMALLAMRGLYQNGAYQEALDAKELVLEASEWPQAQVIATQCLRYLNDYPAEISVLDQQRAVKLVIWDLDDTFWCGTLAEGDALEIPPAHVEMVRELTRRGIVNAICSKNDFAAAQGRLQQAGVWEQFVFPRIAFAPKGELIRNIIEQAQLRAENVLFVDDNAMNLEEARYYNPGLQTLDARQLPTLLALPGLIGKPDGGQRLAQYKLLEQRARERGGASSNEDFLRQSDIRLRITPTRADDAERVHDMLTRTNQLNFTKQRLSLAEVSALIEDSSRMTATIAVRDRFGDHGVVGWYCLHEGRLEHFLFSCRIINLGIEQYVYAHLGQPRLDVVGETASSPFEAESALDYITLETEAARAEPRAQQIQNHRRLRIYASGACDMYYLVGTLANTLTDVTFECNTFRGNTRGVNVATEYLRSCFEMTDADKDFCRRHFHNYTGQTAFNTRIFDGGYDYALFSFNDDAELFTYQHRSRPALRVTLSESATYSVTPVMPPPGEDADAWLCEHFDCEGLITSQRFRDNLLWLAERMPAHTRLLLMTLPEFNYFRDAIPTFPQYRRQCLRLNRVIRELCATDARFGLVEMNHYITDRSHFTDYVMHLRPQRGFLIACEALQQMAVRPVQTELAAQLPLQDRSVALLGKGLETLPYLLALKAAGVEVGACATVEEMQGLGARQPLAALADRAQDYFAIVTPQLGAGVLQELGYADGADGWVLPQEVFNLDWKER